MSTRETATSAGDAEASVRTMVAVVVTAIHRTPLLLRVQECGRVFRYQSHLENAAGVSLRVECLCPGGHGVARLPWRGWLMPSNGRCDLADLPDPRYLPPPA